MLERSTRAPSPLATTLRGPPRLGAEARRAGAADRAALRARRAEDIVCKFFFFGGGGESERSSKVFSFAREFVLLSPSLLSARARAPPRPEGLRPSRAIARYHSKSDPNKDKKTDCLQQQKRRGGRTKTKSGLSLSSSSSSSSPSPSLPLLPLSLLLLTPCCRAQTPATPRSCSTAAPSAWARRGTRGPGAPCTWRSGPRCAA